MKKDNSTFRQKVTLRKEALKYIDAPVIMETHGGRGELFRACYPSVQEGIVFEKNPDKVARLGLQRPTWRVYETDCEMAIRSGIGSDMMINLLDLDPYGSPWDVIDAFFEDERKRAKTLCLAVNDGLRLGIKMGGGWNVKVLEGAVSRYGNVAIYKNYLAVCEELLQKKASKVGYSLTRFAGYYCGHTKQMTHYLAVLNQ